MVSNNDCITARTVHLLRTFSVSSTFISWNIWRICTFALTISNSTWKTNNIATVDVKWISEGEAIAILAECGYFQAPKYILLELSLSVQTFTCAMVNLKISCIKKTLFIQILLVGREKNRSISFGFSCCTGTSSKRLNVFHRCPPLPFKFFLVTWAAIISLWRNTQNPHFGSFFDLCDVCDAYIMHDVDILCMWIGSTLNPSISEICFQRKKLLVTETEHIQSSM